MSRLRLAKLSQGHLQLNDAKTFHCELCNADTELSGDYNLRAGLGHLRSIHGDLLPVNVAGHTRIAADYELKAYSFQVKILYDRLFF